MFYHLPLTRFLPIFLLLLLGLSACAPEFQTDENTYKFFLDQEVRNLTTGYYQRYYVVADTALWEATRQAADTVVPRGPDSMLKFRTNNIWYEAKLGPDGWRANQQYPGWEQSIDSVDREINLANMLNNQQMRVKIPAADIVLNGDSIRLGILHPTGPAYAWNFRAYQPQGDYLLLTTYGNDTLPISLKMDAVGPISRQTVFRVGRYSYVLKYYTPEYDGVIIEQLEDSRGLPYTAELDLNYKPVPVKNPDGTPTAIMRTPGKALFLYFWDGFEIGREIQKIDSLYQALPPAKREKLEIALIAQFNRFGGLEELIAEKGIKLPVYNRDKKTCLRLNCPPFTPFCIFVDSRGRLVNFYERPKDLITRLEEQAR